MRKPFTLFVGIIQFSLLLLILFTGCKTGGDFPLSRSEYDYVPPEMPEERPFAIPAATPTANPTPLPTPMAESVREDESIGGDAVSDSDAEEPEKKGLFSRWFSRDDNEEAPRIERVGDREVQQEAEAGQEEVSAPRENVYRIRSGDAVFITLSGSGGLSEQIETVVDGAGTVKLRFIGAVDADGLTTTELEREIELEYTDRQKIYRKVTARVVVPNKFYFIGGEVRQPGRFPITGRVTLSQAVVAAGNFTEWANERKIILVRNNERVELDFRDISRDPMQDVQLLPGDVVTVSRSTL
jgi:polysaccharide export outer membrane protein